MARGRERRRAERHRVRVRVRFWNEAEGLEGTGVTTDLSDTGMFIETKTSVPLDTRLQLEVDLDSGKYTAVGTVARVLRAARNVQPIIKAGFGVRLVGLIEALEDAQVESEPEGLQVDLRSPEKLATVFMRDIKLGGLHVPTSTPPEPDSVVTVRLLLPSPHGAVEVDGTVLKVTTDPSGAALQLHDVDTLRTRLGQIITA